MMQGQFTGLVITDSEDKQRLPKSLNRQHVQKQVRRTLKLFCASVRRGLTLAQISKEHVKEGDVDWLVAAAVLFYLTKDHLWRI